MERKIESEAEALLLFFIIIFNVPLSGVLGKNQISEFISEFKVRYDETLKRTELIKAIEEIEKDEHIDPSVPEWQNRLFDRFVIFAMAKAWCNLVNEKFPAKNDQYNNSLNEQNIFLKQLQRLVFLGLENYKSITANSKDQSVSKSVKVEFPEKVVEPHLPEINFYNSNIESYVNTMGKINKNLNDTLEKLGSKVNSSNFDREKEKTEYIEFQDMIFNCDITKIEKIIFHGILDDFGITKIIKGRQSESYKVKLLWKLFIHTHTHLYHEKNTQFNTSKVLVNRINLLKLIR